MRTITEILQLPETHKLLTTIYIEVTDACNLKCVHCYVTNRIKEPFRFHTIDVHSIENILNQAKELNVFRIILTGGEPFMHPEILKILEMIHEMNFMCYVMSNATLINDKNIYAVKKYVNRVLISNYGANDESYEGVTRTIGSRRSYLHAIDLLKEHNVPYEERFVLLKENQNDADVFLERKLKIETCICGDHNENYAIAHRADESCLGKIFQSYHFGGELIIKRGLDDLVCNAGKHSLTIKSNLEVVPCNNFGLVVGTLSNGSLKEIWFGNKLKEINEELKFRYFIKCSRCEFKRYSLYLLPCNNYQENQDMHIPSTETCRHCKLISKFDI